MNEIEMQLKQGMLINGGFLTEEEAKRFLTEVLKQDKDGLKREKFKKETDTLIRQLNRLKKGTGSIKSIREAYIAWEDLAKKWLGISMTDLLALEVDYDNQEISRLNIGSERSFLSGRTGDISTKASVSGTQSDVIHGDVGGNGISVINTGKAAFETAAITAYYNLLAPHYNQLFKTWRTEKPTLQEANFNYLKEHDFADRSIFAFARFRPEQLYFFYQLTRGYTENNQALHGRLTEIFADHVAKCHAALLKPNYAGAPISQTVRQEVYPELLYMLRGGFHPDKDPLTSGGDLIVQFTDGFTINLQLKTIFSSTGRDRGGNPIRLSVIIETLKKWQKALKETKPENIANKLFSAQSTKAWIETTNGKVAEKTEDKIREMAQEFLETNWKIEINKK